VKINRHEAIGIKQTIQLAWMQKTSNLMLAGLSGDAIRQELHQFLADDREEAVNQERSKQTRTFAVNNLMRIWVSPDKELKAFRDASLMALQAEPEMALALHWGMISAAYPFWFHVARQTGRLLALQDQVTQAQIVHRLKEQYGDRQTVSRYARFAIRAFIDWGVLQDCERKGCYQKSTTIKIQNLSTAILLMESILHALPDGKCALSMISNNPSLFPFQLPTVSGDLVSRQSDNLEVVRYGLDDELLKLNVTDAI